jgi:K+-sensing histidine kinase KdpD
LRHRRSTFTKRHVNENQNRDGPDIKRSQPHCNPSRQLFEPFYTTKAHGTGLGLAMSRSIIEAHGGNLWAEANRGPGATFSFALPAAEAAD